MGQVLRRLHDYGIRPEDFLGIPMQDNNDREELQVVIEHQSQSSRFPDLSNLPPEIGIEILRHLNATDLCLASCVWNHLANDELLWFSLCRSQWGSVSIYKRCRPSHVSYKQIFMALDEASLTFNSDPNEGIRILVAKGILDDSPIEIARFLHSTTKLWANKKLEFIQQRVVTIKEHEETFQLYFAKGKAEKLLAQVKTSISLKLLGYQVPCSMRPDVLERVVQLQNFSNQFLPNALRKFFKEISAPNERGSILGVMIENFSQRFCACNPSIGLTKDAVFVLCYSLIMLSVDLCSPHVKNKMSKREFIKNTCQAVAEVSKDLAGHMYDNIYLAGHVAPKGCS